MIYLKKFLNAIKEILIYELAMLLTVFLTGYIILLFNPTINIEILTALINQYSFYPIIIVVIIMIFIFYQKYLKLINNNYQQYSFSKTIYYILLGVSIALIMNIIFYFCNQYIKIYSDINISNISIYMSIFITGIIGPIIEEILFRGILFEKLKKFNLTKRALLYSIIIFAITHDHLIEIIYATVLGYVLVYCYHQYQNIFVPIIIHSSANIIIVLYQTTIYRLNNYIIVLILILSLTAFYLAIMELKKDFKAL